MKCNKERIDRREKLSSKDLIHLVNDTERPQIRAGKTHRFIDIWVVVVEDRMFCRQYALNAGWYNAFLRNPLGYIKVNKKVAEIRGIIPEDLDAINEKINDAYIEKYTKRHFGLMGYLRKLIFQENKIAHRMTGAEFMKTTMELVLVNQK